VKKQPAFAHKLAFNKEKVASLSPADLGQLHGGKTAPPTAGPTIQSTVYDFTCCQCTGGTSKIEQPDAGD